MALLHGLLLVFSIITTAPLMIGFSMTIPTPVSDERDHGVLLSLEPLPVHQPRPRALPQTPSPTRQLAPAPLPGSF
jgi:hypothetical protein